MSGIMREVYVPVREPASSFLHDASCVGVLSCLGIALILSVRGGAPAATISAIVAAGFLLAYFIPCLSG